MTRYAYNSQIQPPAPFVLITLRIPVNGDEIPNTPAQIDTGADRTVIPLEFVVALGLPVVGGITVVGFGGVPAPTPLYSATIVLHATEFSEVEIIAGPGEPWVLLGRDVINYLRLILDGPEMALEMS